MTHALLERNIAGAAGPWLLDTGADAALPPVLIFPHAGGGPAAYRQLAQRWSHRLRPFLVHLPGRESRLDEEPIGALPKLVRALLPAAMPLLSSRFVLYGHSMGALVAFELARHARRCFGIEPDHLIISGYPAPSLARRTSRHLLPDAELWETVCAIGGFAPAVASDPQIRSLLLPAIRADFGICDTYSYLPEQPLTCPISAFVGTQDKEVPIPDIRAWDGETSGEFRSEALLGDHFFNLKQPGDFADRVLRELEMTVIPAGPRTAADLH